jgi:3-hydroxybutyryl-CoA dehydrogenase
MTIDVVGVVGAGTIGAGVAEALAQTGHRVVLVDATARALDAALERVRASLRLQRLLQRTAVADVATVLGRIDVTVDLHRLRDVSFVIENVTEKWNVKEPLYRTLDDVCEPSCVLAANTSCIPITRLAALTGRAARVLGIHFMNPVPMKPVVEVIRGYHTSDETIAVATGVLERMGKQAVVVNDAPGFVSNRVLMLAINEAVFTLQEQVAAVDDIDRIFKQCFGHKMGPLETADLIGLDTILFSLDVLYESFHDSKYRPCPLLQKMVAAGLHGGKTGRGFYDYGQP